MNESSYKKMHKQRIPLLINSGKLYTMLATVCSNVMKRLCFVVGDSNNIIKLSKMIMFCK